METLRGLPLVEDLLKPVPDEATTFYQTAVAKGTGEYGTYTIYDFMGSCTGLTAQNNMQNVNAIMASLPLSSLLDVYNRIANTIAGVYGPFPTRPTVIVPPGPGGGTYASKDLALSSGLIPAAESVIQNYVNAFPGQCNSLNQSFAAICNRYIYEYGNQQAAGLIWADLTASSKTSTISFIGSLDTVGLDIVPQGESDFVTALADTTKISGQAIIGSLREGRNNEAMDKA